MKRYIGLDVHAASTTFAVISEAGKRLGSYVVETNGQALVEQLKTIPGEKHVCLEEGTQSAWIYEILSPHAAEVVVAAIPESRGQKNDERDAFHLADELRTGALKKRVFKEAGDYKTLREIGRTHAMIVRDVVRVRELNAETVDLLVENAILEDGKEQLREQRRGLAVRMGVFALFALVPAACWVAFESVELTVVTALLIVGGWGLLRAIGAIKSAPVAGDTNTDKIPPNFHV